jgi:hypothetical protein
MISAGLLSVRRFLAVPKFCFGLADVTNASALTSNVDMSPSAGAAGVATEERIERLAVKRIAADVAVLRPLRHRLWSTRSVNPLSR